ncbi:type II secretion system protein [Janthinobacterium sp. SUN100]|uniref:type II secretion system protein n=1 Tax=Janthinobacterium sp. SUN100 TaxID=3004101 RepID=UPI0025B0425C|nr:type II secretion system protein [Janthinobacterium sp. SUN100]MDN2700403.1 type II secretion system protein [Janthinobacterium sp. SUN100]
MRHERGFSYVVVMFLVAVTAITSVRALENVQVSERRDKEAELLWRGMAYRNAIRDYYLDSPGTAHSFPQQLSALLLDERFTRPRRPLRRLYRDPMTEDGNWGLVHNNDGALIGVYSRSSAKPLKQAGFVPELQAFTGTQRYSDWKFVFQP